MRPVFENGAPVPAFLNKLWKMVDDEKTDNLISWSPGGQSFIIKHQGDFCTKLLPQFYKHSNMASFVRQLNMYGFHKVSNIENGIHKGEREEIEFIHLYFKKGEPTLVEKIKRKMSSRIPNNSGSNDGKNMEMMTKVLKDVAQMRGRQLSLDAQLATMKQHNVALWRELSVLRRKHHKQQQIVNKLIQFLVSLVQPSRNNINGLGVKRRYPLMLNDIAQNNGKSKKSRVAESSGPTIHELDTTDNTLLEEAGMLEDYIEPVIEINSPESQRTRSRGNSTSKNASPVLLDFDESNEEDCPLSPHLLFATSPHLVTPACESEASTQVNSANKQAVEQEEEVPRIPLEQDEDDMLNELDDDSTMIDAIIQPDSGIQNPENGIQTIMVSSDDANILRAAAQEFGFIISNDENGGGGTITLDNGATISSMNDLTELLQSSVGAVKSEPLDAVPVTITVNNDADGGGGGGRDVNPASTVVCTIEPSTSTVVPQTSQKTVTNEGEATDNRTVATVQAPELSSASDLDNHLDSVQTELESLKDLLVGEGYSIDANTLLGLFGADDPMSYTLPMPGANEYDTQETSNNDSFTVSSQSNASNRQSSDPVLSGSELMCAPTFDFDMFSTPDNTFLATPENSMDAFDVKNLRYNDHADTNNISNSPVTPHF